MILSIFLSNDKTVSDISPDKTNTKRTKQCVGKSIGESGAGGLRLKRNTISKGGDNLCGPMSCDIRNIKGRKGRANGGAVQRRKKDQGKEDGEVARLRPAKGVARTGVRGET